MMNNIEIMQAYYKAVGGKDITSIAQYLDEDVQFIGPLVQMRGKEAVLQATKRFTTLFKSLHIRASFGSKDLAMLVYDLERRIKLLIAIYPPV